MAADKASCKTLRVSDAASGQGATTISVADFSAQGCTVRAITIETQATAGGSGTIAITGGGNDLFGGSAATTANVVRVVGGYQIPLTTTSANLSLAPTDSIVITRAVANSQNDVTFYFGDETPSTVTTS